MQGGVAAEGFEWSRLLNSEEPPVQEHVINHEDPWVQAPGTSGMESLDYEVVENLAYREDQAQRGIWHQGSYAAMKWLFALLIGIGTGLSAFVINVAVENFSGWKFIATFAIMRHSYMAGFLVYTLFNVALVFSSVSIVTHFAPAAADSRA